MSIESCGLQVYPVIKRYIEQTTMTIRTVPDAVRRQQTAASDPTSAVFVSANAGAGKTHVLAQRVIRLMLDGGPDGVDPSKILCITFTKAAAANMATRVYDRLRDWIALD